MGDLSVHTGVAHSYASEGGHLPIACKDLGDPKAL